MDELYNQTKAKFSYQEIASDCFQKPICFNVIPEIGDVIEEEGCMGDTDEEGKAIP